MVKQGILDLNIAVNNVKRMPKIRQIIWLDYETNHIVYQLAEKFNMAPNTFISELLKKILVEKAEYFQEPAVQPEVKTCVACPICWQLFPDVNTVRQHVIMDHSLEEFEKILEEFKALKKEGEKQNDEIVEEAA